MQMNLFDLNLIRSLDALLTELNVTRAADQLCVTQQAMSGSLRRLRSHFNDELLVRVGRHFEPSPLGRALRQPTRELLLQIGLTLEIKPEFRPHETSRHFRIAMSDYAVNIFLPHFMPLLVERAPGIVCDIRPINDTVFRDIEQGDLEFCLLPSNWRLYQTTKPQGLRSIKLFEDDFVCAVDVDHPQTQGRLNLTEYEALPHCMVTFRGGVRSMVEMAWVAAGLEMVVTATATSFAHLLFMVPGTPMIATAQRKLVERFEPLLPIRLIECPLQIGILDETLIWHPRHERDPAHGFMRALFASAAAALVPTE